MASLAIAADLEYSGADNGWFETAGNWTNASTGAAATAKPTNGDNLLIGNGRQVKLGSNGGSRSFSNMTLTLEENASLKIDDNSAFAYSWNNSTLVLKAGSTFTASSAVAGGNSAVTLNGTTVTIEKGATMNVQRNPKIGFANTQFNIHGANGLVCGETWMDQAGKKQYTFNLFEEGSVSFGVLHPASGVKFTLTGSLDAVAAGEGEITLRERVLMSFASISEGATMPDDIFSSDCAFTALDGSALTLTDEDLSGKTLTESDLGSYNLVCRDNQVIVLYASRAAVPEPATATLSLLALAGLMTRRRK